MSALEPRNQLAVTAMPFKTRIECDGGCRRNGRPDAVGGAGIVVSRRWGSPLTYQLPLPLSPPPTNQRAELTALILALEVAADIQAKLNAGVRSKFVLATDSEWAINCVNIWSPGWQRTGWKNSRGLPVANQDLIKDVLRRAEIVRQQGAHITFKHIPRGENSRADAVANRACDEAERLRKR